VITGEYFAQIQSIYGSASQEGRLAHKTFHGRILYEVHAIESLAPFLPLLLIVAVVLAFWRRDPRVFAPVTVLGGALGFDMASYMANGIQDYLRYWIVAVPLGVMLLGGLVAAVQTPHRPHGTANETDGSRHSSQIYGLLLALCLVLVVMIPTTMKTGSAMLNPNIGVEEVPEMGFIFKAHPNAADLKYANAYPQALALGSYFVSLHLPDGDIVVDNSAGCIPMMIVTSGQPKLFVIPNDRDFQRILADPITFHVRYILEPDPASVPVSAPNITYPNLWSSGAGFTKMVHQFAARGPCAQFRLFRVLHHSNPATSQ
jgi:hypothetical protein